LLCGWNSNCWKSTKSGETVERGDSPVRQKGRESGSVLGSWSRGEAALGENKYGKEGEKKACFDCSRVLCN